MKRAERLTRTQRETTLCGDVTRCEGALTRHVLWLLAILLGAAGNAAAGTASGSLLPEPGTRIRLTARMPERQRWTGAFISVANDTITMRAGDMNGGVLAVPALNVTRFEISQGTRSSILLRACAGLVVGAVAGAGVVYFATRGQSEVGPGPYSLFGAVIGGVVGAAIGAGSGARTTAEHWRALPLNDLRTAHAP